MLINIIDISFLLPIIGIILLYLLNKVPFFQYCVSITIPILFIVEQYIAKSEITRIWLNLNDILHIKFHYTHISNLFLLMVGILWLITNIYSIGYIKLKEEINYTRFTSIIFASIACVSLIANSGNLFTLFIFYEALTIITFFLVSYSSIPEAKEVGLKYLTTLLITSSCLFVMGAAIVFYHTQSFRFLDVGIFNLFPQIFPWWLLPISLVAFLYGCSKAATVPLHFWLPEAMIAHTPVSALLHAVAVVKSGIIALLYIVIYIYGIQYLSEASILHPIAMAIPKYIAGFSAIYASILAIKKHEIKKVLAYSTIGQLGYMVMIIFSYHDDMPRIVILHLIAHAFAKITLFFCAGFLYLKYHVKTIDKLNSIAKKDFIICFCFAICSFSIIGIPPTIGFMSKFNILLYAFKNSEFFIIFIILFGSILNCYYFLPLLARMFFGPNDEEHEQSNKHEQNNKSYLFLYISIIFTSAVVVILFFYSNLIIL